MAARLDLEKEKIYPLILKMSWPSIIAMTAMSIYNLIDTFWLARLSSQALAALTICFPIQLIASAVGVGTGIGAGSFSARMFGAGKNNQAQQTAGQILFLSCFFGFVMILFVLFFGEPLLRLFGASDDILPLCRDYLFVIVFAAPFGLFCLMANNLLRAEGRPLFAMNIFLVIFAASAILDPLLIFGIGPFPRMEIKGAAFAALVANFSGFVFSLMFLSLKSSKYEMTLKSVFPDVRIIQSIYATGLPTMIINLVGSVVLVVYNHVLAGFGFQAIAAFGICFRVMAMASMVVFGIGAGLMPIVAFSEGAKLYHRKRESVFAALKISFLFSFLTFLFLEIFAAHIVTLFSGDASLILIATNALRIHASSLVPVAPIIISVYMFLGAGRGMLALFLFFFRDVVVFIPLLMILPVFGGINGAWAALPLSNLIALLVIIFWMKKELQVP